MDNNYLHNEKELFERMAKGDEQVFRRVFDAYKHPFYTAAFKMTHEADVAEEIVQEVFVTLWEKRIQVSLADNPRGYLMTILHNCIYAHFRKLALEKKLRRNMGEEAIEANNNVEDILLAKENRELLEAVISRMPAQQKLIYKLSKQEGLSRDEIAFRLQLSPNTVKNHLAEAVEFMRQNLKNGASGIIWLAIWQSL